MRLTLRCQRPLTYAHAQPLLNVPFCSPLIQFPINLSARATTIACQQISHIENASRAIQLTRQTLECRSFTLKWFYIINSCHLNEYKCAFKCYWMRFYRFQIHWMICWSSVCLRYFNNKTIGLFLLFLKIPTIPNVAVQNFKLLIVPIVSVRIVCFDKTKSRTILHFIHFLRLLKV